MNQIVDRYTPTTPAPVEKGHWMIEREVMHPEIGRVKDVYWTGSGWVMDLVLYSPDGDRVGRSSKPMGGPKHFEPAVPVEYWERIEKPQFPLDRDRTGYRDWRADTTLVPPEASS